MTQDSYNNYVNIIRARLADLASKMTSSYTIGNNVDVKSKSYDLAIVDASLELMEEYQLPIEGAVHHPGYIQENFLSYKEMQQMDSLVQDILNTNYQIDYILDTPDGWEPDLIYPSYYGINFTGFTPTEGEILTGGQLIAEQVAVTFPLRTDHNQFGWMAVDKEQTNKIYTEWHVDASNMGDVGPTNFIKYDSIVTVNGRQYDIYMFRYQSQLTDDIRLS